MLYVVILICLGGLFAAAKSLLLHPGPEAQTSGALLAFGFLLLAAFCAARIAHVFRLPHLVAYLLTGVVAGPYVLDLVSRDVLGTLQLVNGVAVALIALTAGTEMSVARMRPVIRSVAWKESLEENDSKFLNHLFSAA